MADNNTINNITEPWDGHSFKEVEEFIKEELETIPTVPTNVSAFTNDADYSTKEYVDEKVGVKQDWLVSGRNIRTVNGSSLLGEGNIVIPKGQDGKDAVNPFKGWFNSADDLPSNPQNGDYAYVKVRINSVDYVHIFTYDESAPNHWGDTGREVDTSGIYTFFTEEVLNQVSIVNDLETGGAHNVLSAQQGVSIKEDINELSDKWVISENLSKRVADNDDREITYAVRRGFFSLSNQSAILYPFTGNTLWKPLTEANKVDWIAYRVEPGSYIKVTPPEGGTLNEGYICVLSAIPNHDYNDSTLPVSFSKGWAEENRIMFKINDQFGSYSFKLPDLYIDTEQPVNSETDMFLYVTTHGAGPTTVYNGIYWMYSGDGTNASELNERISALENGLSEGVLTTDDIIDNLTTNDNTKVLSASQGNVIGNRITSLENKWALNSEINLYEEFYDGALGNSVNDYTEETKALKRGYVRTCSNTVSSNNVVSVLYNSLNEWDLDTASSIHQWVAYRVEPLSVIRLYKTDIDADNGVLPGNSWILKKIEHKVFVDNSGVSECPVNKARLSTGSNSEGYKPGNGGRFKINDTLAFINETDEYYEFQLPDLADGEDEMWFYTLISNGDTEYCRNYYNIKKSSVSIDDVYNDIDTIDEDLSVLEKKVDSMSLNTGNDTYFDSDVRNLNILDSIGNPLRPLEYDLYKSITLDTTADPRFYEVYPQTLQHKALYDLGRVMSYIKWEPKKMETGADGYRMPVTDGFKEDGYYNGYWYGIPYTSVKENDKYVGFDVSIYTFMTAVNNPYSLLYTEITRGGKSRSAWGNTYYGINCATYYGITCSELTSMLSGLPTGYSTDMQSWLYKNGNKLAKVYPQEYEYLQPGDILVCYDNETKEPAHCRMVAAIEREPIDATAQNPKSNGRVTALDIVHGSGTHCATFRRTTTTQTLANKLTYQVYNGIKYMKPGNDYYFVVAYRSIEKYKNLALYNSFNGYDNFYDTSKILLDANIGSYNDYYITSTGQSSWVDTYQRNLTGFNNEQTNFLNAPQKVYEYNNYICTYAGDKACFNENDLVVVNYNLDDAHSFDPADIVFVKDDVNITDSVKYPTELDMENALQAKQINHAIKVVDDNGESFGPGTYSATITVEEDGENVDYITQWEVIETNRVDLEKDETEKDMVNITFGFSNGIPFAISVGLQNGHKLLLRELTEDEVLNRNIKTNLKRLAKEQTGNELEEADKNLLYFKMFFRGEFGVAIGKQPCGFLFD